MLLEYILLGVVTSTALASVTCIRVGNQATAAWTNAAGQSCTWTGKVGSNFGVNPQNSGDYGCNGRCGPGCNGASLGNVYTQQCWSHDICSYFYNATGGSRDANCGKAYDDARESFLLGQVRGCGQTNPQLAASKPTVSPRCQ